MTFHRLRDRRREAAHWHHTCIGLAQMLVISRRKGQSISIGDEIELVVTELHRSSVKLGIRAPRGYAVLRGEVRDSIATANQAAAESILDDSQFLESRFAGSKGLPAEMSVSLRQTPGTDQSQNGDTTASERAPGSAVSKQETSKAPPGKDPHKPVEPRLR